MIHRRGKDDVEHGQYAKSGNDCLSRCCVGKRTRPRSRLRPAQLGWCCSAPINHASAAHKQHPSAETHSARMRPAAWQLIANQTRAMSMRAIGYASWRVQNSRMESAKTIFSTNRSQALDQVVWKA